MPSHSHLSDLSAKPAVAGKLLVLEDNAIYRELLIYSLAEHLPTVQTTGARDLQTAEELAVDQSFQILLADASIFRAAEEGAGMSTLG